MVEVLACLDASTGRTHWEHIFADFISDIIYDRYATGAPTVDPATGNVFLMTSPGLLVAFDRDGGLLWERSMMEEFGRLTFPNALPDVDRWREFQRRGAGQRTGCDSRQGERRHDRPGANGRP